MRLSWCHGQILQNHNQQQPMQGQSMERRVADGTAAALGARALSLRGSSQHPPLPFPADFTSESETDLARWGGVVSRYECRLWMHH